MQGMGLEETIRKRQEYLDKGSISNEASVKRVIIDPILEDLGWDDPDHVKLEYPIERRFADYALLDDNGIVKIFIEAKDLGKLDTRGEEQLFDYAVRGKQAPLLVFTDGAEWKFYLTYKPGYGREERIFASLDLRNKSDENINHLVESFSKYLNRDDVLSGAAYQVAETDFERHKKLEKEKGEFRQWWNAQLKAPSEDLASCAKEIFAIEHNVDLELGIGTIQSLIKDASASLKDRTAPDLISQQTAPPRQRYNQSDRFGYTQSARSRKPHTKLKVTYGNREPLFYAKASETFERVMNWIIDDYGINRVAPCSYSYIKIRAEAERLKTFKQWVPIPNTDYWLSLYNSTDQKARTLNDIKRHLGIRNLTVEVI